MNIVEGSQVPREIPPPKRNNLVQYKGGGYNNIIQRIKYLIAFQSVLGINRMYLIDCHSCAKRFCLTYDILVVISNVIVIFIGGFFSATQALFRNTVAIEYLLLAICALILQRKPLTKFFSYLQSFDETLNISDDIKLTSPIRLYVYGIIEILLYNFFEQMLFLSYGIETYELQYSMYAAYSGIVIHDAEIIFFSVLLIMVSRRLRVLKAHVAKIFSLQIDKDSSEEINKLEELSKKVNLDVSSLHKAYDSLYKCSLQLNSVITFPIIIMLVTAGFSTILILKNLISVLQTQQYQNTTKVITMIGIARSLKYIALLMIPCYFSNVTKIQVDVILTLLHDVLNNNNNQLDKVERRKLKAFSQLCRDNAFEYQLWGIARLDMSLPLSYTSLCTTYLIIFVQFSKFIS
ncbi:uncharacterized protein LOC123869100 [Maniola jurtina]|uniref:uncharacterized protein LOC123869100 n=1 Tax=Maniola jurtina TaxID=191418 RepID=UPI001E6860A6|nr:uncharacterized protein LOC123869100 [Maniola jurtina]